MFIPLESSWLTVLQTEFDKEYMKQLTHFLKEEQQHHVVYPPNEHVFEAFSNTPFDKVRVVILGQDPYHGPNEAHGLSFSVQKGIRVPPSLRNIYKELHSDLEIPIPTHGNLLEWAQRGVLLLNTVLTVRHKTANSHQKKGWETFTDKAIEELSKHRNNLVFILWGSKAKNKMHLIDQKKHHIIQSAHPSPLAVRYGFFGSKPFSKTNLFFQSIGQKPIDWSISS
jgi:uracil-DNA glycosylase